MIEFATVMVAFYMLITMQIDPNLFSSREGLDLYITYRELFGTEENVVLASLMVLFLYFVMMFIGNSYFRLAVNIAGFVFLAFNGASFLINYPNVALGFVAPLLTMKIIGLYEIISEYEEQRKEVKEIEAIQEFKQAHGGHEHDE